MQSKEFARRVQASFDAAFGSGVSTVEVLGPSPDDVTATAFEVLVRPPFGASFAIPNEQLKSIPEIDESAGSIAALSCQLSKDMLETVQQFMNALVIADHTVFLPDEGVVDVLEILDEANREELSREELSREVFEALGAASTCWSTPEGAGEFNSSRAEKIGEELLAKIDAYVAHSEVSDVAEEVSE